MKPIDQILLKLADLIQQGRFAELETEWLEIKPVPVDGGDWKERHKSVNAFLNTRGGILILGVEEEGAGPGRRCSWTIGARREIGRRTTGIRQAAPGI